MKKHANAEKLIGNTNAKKDTSNDAVIYARCPVQFKNALVARAQGEGKKLGQWVIDVLERELTQKTK